MTDIRSFVLPMNFSHGFTEADQGNTHGATLLGFADALPQYRVATTQLPKAGLSLSVCSTVPRVPVDQRGLRMLWFVIGELILDVLLYSDMHLNCLSNDDEPINDEESPTNDTSQRSHEAGCEESSDEHQTESETSSGKSTEDNISMTGNESDA